MDHLVETLDALAPGREDDTWGPVRRFRTGDLPDSPGEALTALRDLEKLRVRESRSVEAIRDLQGVLIAQLEGHVSAAMCGAILGISRQHAAKMAQHGRDLLDRERRERF